MHYRILNLRGDDLGNEVLISSHVPCCVQEHDKFQHLEQSKKTEGSGSIAKTAAVPQPAHNANRPGLSQPGRWPGSVTGSLSEDEDEDGNRVGVPSPPLPSPLEGPQFPLQAPLPPSC